ncbi:MAG: type II toxin-antitoxin system VapC family toxin [Gloeotrichia echinulata DVL01]
MELLFDTNIFIYHLNNQLSEAGTDLLRQGISGLGAYSVISRIELLGFKQSTDADIQARRLLSRMIELPLTSEIAERTIAIRKRLKIKVPDAIIAATALEYSLQLVSRNQDDFSQVEDLRWVNPFEI